MAKEDFIIENGVLRKYYGKGADVTIPDEVTSIGERAFYGRSSLTTITIPSSVREIEQKAFWGCSSLTTITIPASVREIGAGITTGCDALMIITVADGNPRYHSEHNCIIETETKRLVVGCAASVIPAGVTRICASAFRYCGGLTSITIPDGVTSIESGAFCGCSSLTTITLPSSVRRIGSSAFGYCRSLTTFSIPEGVTRIEAWTFDNCSSLTTITIPSSVREIEQEAFKECSSLTTIAIPESVRSIGASAFAYCNGLTSITIPGVTTLGSRVFAQCPELTTFTIPESVRSISGSMFFGCVGLRAILIPKTVTKIGFRALASCTGLTSIYYEGTKEQWDAIDKGKEWDAKTGDYVIHYNADETAKMTMEALGDVALDSAVTSFEYSKKPRGGYKATLVGISSDEKEVVFPGEYDGEAVTEFLIGKACKALLNKEKIVFDRVVIPGTAKKYTDVIQSMECRTLVLEEGITTLHKRGVLRFLEEIYLPKSLKVMEIAALGSSRALKKIHIPAGSSLSYVEVGAIPCGEGGAVTGSLLPSCTVENGSVYIPSEDNPYFMLVSLGQSGAVNAATEIAAPSKALEDQNQIFSFAQPSYFLTLRELIERSDRQKEKPFALSEGRKIVGDAVFDENGTRLCGLDDQVVVSYFYYHHGWFWDTFVGFILGEVPSPKTFGYRGWKYLSTVKQHRYAEYATVYPVIGDGSEMPPYDYEKEIGVLNVLSCREAFNLIGEVDSECG